MKKYDLIHTTILIVAILLGYTAITNIIYCLTIFTYMGRDYPGSLFQPIVSQLFLIVLYSVACYVLVRNGRKYAGMIVNHELEEAADPTAQLALDRADIIFALLVGIGLYEMIQPIPTVIYGLYDKFADKVSSNLLTTPSPQKNDLIIDLLKVTIGAMIIYAAAPLTRFINKVSPPRGTVHPNPGKDVL